MRFSGHTHTNTPPHTHTQGPFGSLFQTANMLSFVILRVSLLYELQVARLPLNDTGQSEPAAHTCPAHTTVSELSLLFVLRQVTVLLTSACSNHCAQIGTEERVGSGPGP